MDNTIITDAGEYTIIAEINDEGHSDVSINLYVGRASDGHYDLIATDNSSNWVVGDEDDHERNNDQWSTLEGHGLDLDAVREIDEDLADWLEARRGESWYGEKYEVWLVPNGRLADFSRGMLGTGYPDACQCWWTADDLDEVREKYAEWAAENFDRECGPGEDYADDEERDKARADAVARARESLSIEWHDDLKWVRTRKVRELRNGGVEFVEVL